MNVRQLNAQPIYLNHVNGSGHKYTWFILVLVSKLGMSLLRIRTNLNYFGMFLHFLERFELS